MLLGNCGYQTNRKRKIYDRSEIAACLGWRHAADVYWVAVMTLLLGNCGYQTNRKKVLWQKQNRSLLTMTSRCWRQLGRRRDFVARQLRIPTDRKKDLLPKPNRTLLFILARDKIINSLSRGASLWIIHEACLCRADYVLSMCGVNMYGIDFLPI